MQDRLSIEKNIGDNVVAPIDNTKFLGLNSQTSERIELFLFAMAFGVHKGIPRSLKSKLGFIRDTSINPPFNMSILYSLLVQEARENNETDKISNRDEAFEIAQKYANTGFVEIEALLNQCYKGQYDKVDNESEKSIIWDMLAKLDEQYDELFSSTEIVQVIK